MDELRIIGDDIYFNAFLLGRRPPGMPETQWSRVVCAIDGATDDTREEIEDTAYERGYEAGKLAASEVEE